MTERLRLGWVDIHKLFYAENGRPIISISTLQQKYGSELKELGIVFRWKMGPTKRPMVACWPSKVRSWWIRKQQQLYEKGLKPWDRM